MKNLRVKLQNQKNPEKFKYHTTPEGTVKVGDTITFKWDEAWTVIKILAEGK
jgi:hypothetical protein